MFESLLRQEIGFHDLDINRSSVLATKLATYPPLCKGLTSDKIGFICQGMSGVGFALIVSYAVNWKLSLLMTVFVPIGFFSGVFSTRAATGNLKVDGKSAIEEGGRILIETVENIRTIVSLGNLNNSHFKMGIHKLFKII